MALQEHNSLVERLVRGDHDCFPARVVLGPTRSPENLTHGRVAVGGSKHLSMEMVVRNDQIRVSFRLLL